MNGAAIATSILIALLKTSGEGGTIQLPYDTPEACEAAGERLEAQFESLTLEKADQSPAEGSPRVVWTCFDPRN
ncbi:MAG: hypothetical protein ACK4TJ_00180 [Tabrizicola sp.]